MVVKRNLVPGTKYFVRSVRIGISVRILMTPRLHVRREQSSYTEWFWGTKTGVNDTLRASNKKV